MGPSGTCLRQLGLKGSQLLENLPSSIEMLTSLEILHIEDVKRCRSCRTLDDLCRCRI